MMESKFSKEAKGVAISVKTHGMTLCQGGSDKARETAWQRASTKWWAKADQAAKAAGFDGVVQCGRSGGWAATTPPWDGNGPNSAAQFNSFRRGITSLMGQVQNDFAKELALVIREEHEAATKYANDLGRIRLIFKRAEISPEDQDFLAHIAADGLQTQYPANAVKDIQGALQSA